jgi:hypothetical protein
MIHNTQKVIILIVTVTPNLIDSDQTEAHQVMECLKTLLYMQNHFHYLKFLIIFHWLPICDEV